MRSVDNIPEFFESDEAWEAAHRDLPRRCYLDLLTPAERSIFDAIQAVETLPADVRLTDAVVLLGQAKDKVADFVDGHGTPSGHPPAQEAPPQQQELQALRDWKASALKQLAKSDVLHDALWDHGEYLGWDVHDAAADLIRKLAAQEASGHPPAEAQADPPKPDRIEWQRGYQAGYSAGRKRVTLYPDEQRALLCLFGGYLWIEQIPLTQDALAAAVDAFVTLWSDDVHRPVAGADAPGPGGTLGDRGAGEGKPDV